MNHLLPAPLKSFYESFHTGDVDSLDACFSDTWSDHTLPADRTPGLQGLKDSILVLRDTVLDLNCSVERVVSEREFWSTQLVFTGVHNAFILGAPAVGGPIRFISFEIHRIYNGKILESWHLEDNLTKFQQMGIMPNHS